MFNLDNPFWNTINKICDLVILNLLYVVCSIPLITIGASTTAMYTVLRKMRNDEGGSAAKEFFKAFRSNFKQATILWLILFAIGMISLYEMYLTTLVITPVLEILRYLFLAVLMVWVMVVSYVFPIQSRFENTIRGTLRNALLMSLVHLFPWTVPIVILNLLPWIIVLLIPQTTYLMLQLMMWVGFVVIAEANGMMFEKIFEKYINAEEE